MPEARAARIRPSPLTFADVSLGKADRAFLQVLAQYPEGTTKTRLSLLSGYSLRSSHFKNTLSKLRSLGLIGTSGEPIVPTDDGLAAAGPVERRPQPGEELVGYWIARLGRAEAAFLAAFAGAYPRPLARDELSEQTGYSETSSHFKNTLSRLRTLGLIAGMRAADDLMA